MKKTFSLLYFLIIFPFTLFAQERPNGWGWCGDSYYRSPIKPSHYLLFKIPLYNGDFYTDIRLKLYTRDAVYYSNEYKGRINYKQFNLTRLFATREGKLAANFDFLSF
jgi:hypothetical protein